MSTNTQINGPTILTDKVTGNGAGLSYGRSAISLTADANRTLVAAEFNNRHMEFTSTVSLTATRNIVLPLTDGMEIVVFNNTTGGQSLQFIGATGTGITVANAKTAILRCNGTNWLRVTADV